MTITPEYLLPPNEMERLQALRQYDILHSLQEPVFNEFVALTARIFHLPISLIALVDADEVEYKANEGLPGLRQQPRVEALCALAVRQRQTVVLADVAQEPTLTAEAATAAEAKGLRFYAGAPLAVLGHRAIGTLCVIDRRPRSFSADEQRVLEHSAQLVAGTIAVRHCCRSLGPGDKQWQLVQRHLVDEIRELVALVRYLSARFGHQVPVSGAVLDTVQRRLRDIGHLLEEYTTCD